MRDLTRLPHDLPIPVDDGACDHLCGKDIPSLELPSTIGKSINLSAVGSARIVVYCYPMTGDPEQPLPSNWNLIPGARGCTPQACNFRDHQDAIEKLGAEVFGLSTQTKEEQLKASQRLHLKFPLLSDAQYRLVNALKLPTFDFDGVTLIKRHTLVIKNRKIEKVFYPVFPPNKSAEDVISWLAALP